MTKKDVIMVISILLCIVLGFIGIDCYYKIKDSTPKEIKSEITNALDNAVSITDMYLSGTLTADKTYDELDDIYDKLEEIYHNSEIDSKSKTKVMKAQTQLTHIKVNLISKNIGEVMNGKKELQKLNK